MVSRKIKPFISKMALSGLCFVLANCTTTKTVHEKIEIDSKVNKQEVKAAPVNSGVNSVANSPDGDGFIETAQAGEGGDTLFARIGGQKELADFASRFVDAMVKNSLTAPSMRGNLERFKSQLAIQLCELAGGPCHYQGKSMKVAHGALDITPEQWKAMGQIFIITLHDMGVPKKERMELANLVAPSKHDIVK